MTEQTSKVSIVEFVFYKKRGIIPRIVRYFTDGHYDHVAVNFPAAGITIESIGGRIFGVNGVVISAGPFDHHRGRRSPSEYSTKVLVGEPTLVASALTEHMRHVGSRYDYRGAFGFALKFLRPGSGKRWYCSELAASIFGSITNVKLTSKRPSPTSLYDIVSSYTWLR